jgi:hypothetical protein
MSIPIRVTTFVTLLVLSSPADRAPNTVLGGQQHPDRKPVVSSRNASPGASASENHDVQSAVNHEVWLAILDDALIAVQSSKGSYLVVIARLGKGEKNARLNKRRLEIVQGFMTRDRKTPVRLAAATGEGVPELGRIELYVSNELYAVLPYLRNRVAAPLDVRDPDFRPVP